jgi:hypothetical protein
MISHCSAGSLFNFKGPWPFKIKTYVSVLMHFIVAWRVNVAAATNFHGCSALQEATTAVIAIPVVLYVIMMTFFLSGRQRQISTAENPAQLKRSTENPQTYVDHVYSNISPYIVAYRYHIGSGKPKAATNVVAACVKLLPY